jgi:hypothetical protein
MYHVRARGEVNTDFGEEAWGEIPLGRPRCRYEDNIKIDLQEMGCGAWNELK